MKAETGIIIFRSSLSTTLDLDAKINEVDDACIAISYNFTGIDPNQDKEKKLLEYVDQVTTQESAPTPTQLQPTNISAFSVKRKKS